MNLSTLLNTNEYDTDWTPTEATETADLPFRKDSLVPRVEGSEVSRGGTGCDVVNA